MTYDTAVINRRIDVARLINDGHTYKQIMQATGVSDATVTRDVTALKSLDALREAEQELDDLRQQMKLLERLLVSHAVIATKYAKTSEIAQATRGNRKGEWNEVLLEELERRARLGVDT